MASMGGLLMAADQLAKQLAELSRAGLRASAFRSSTTQRAAVLATSAAAGTHGDQAEAAIASIFVVSRANGRSRNQSMLRAASQNHVWILIPARGTKGRDVRAATVLIFIPTAL
jgi:hypothetical protein